MTEVVDAQVVEPGPMAGALEHALGELIGAQRMQKYRISRAAGITRAMLRQ